MTERIQRSQGFYLTTEHSVKYDVPVIKLLFALMVSTVISVSPLYLDSLVSASGFTLRKVGSLDVDGLVYSHLWYTNGAVTFSGGTLPNEAVTATIDGTAGTATADASGNWSYTATLAAGDHTVSFSSIASTVSFTLTIGTVPEGVGGLPTATAPTVGSAGPTLALVSIGVGLLLLPLWKMRKPQRV